MCGNPFKSQKIKIPKADIPAVDLLPSTEAKAPESPILGDEKKKKGKSSLTISRNAPSGGTGLNI